MILTVEVKISLDTLLAVILGFIQALGLVYQQVKMAEASMSGSVIPV